MCWKVSRDMLRRTEPEAEKARSVANNHRERINHRDLNVRQLLLLNNWESQLDYLRRDAARRKVTVIVVVADLARDLRAQARRSEEEVTLLHNMQMYIINNT